jgi:hypothetical protein
MHVTYHHRALDILCGPEPYLPITQAQVFDAASDELLAEHDFLAINKSQIVFLYETGKPLFESEERVGIEGEEASGEPTGEGESESPPEAAAEDAQAEATAEPADG